jgi:hypothetical protein
MPRSTNVDKHPAACCLLLLLLLLPQGIKCRAMDLVLFVRHGSFYNLFDVDADVGLSVGLNLSGAPTPNMWKVSNFVLCRAVLCEGELCHYRLCCTQLAAVLMRSGELLSGVDLCALLQCVGCRAVLCCVAGGVPHQSVCSVGSQGEAQGRVRRTQYYVSV